MVGQVHIAKEFEGKGQFQKTQDDFDGIHPRAGTR